MDERPGTPPSDAWQPHEPGAPAAPGWGPGVPAPGAPASGVPAPGTADWSTSAPPATPAPPAAAAWPSYGPDVAAAGRRDTGVPRSRRILAGAALATGLAVGGAGVAAAVTSGSDALPIDARSGVPGFFPGSGEGSAQELPGQSGQVPQDVAPRAEGFRGGHHGGHHGGGRGGFGFRGALHGELVVPQEDGTGTRTITVQSGSVTSVSSTRLVVKSTDGFTSTYVLNSSTDLLGEQALSAVKVGHEVSVVGSKSGSTLTAIRVADRNLRPSFDDRQHRQSPTPPPSGSPTTSGTSSRSA
jgi:hypothetical protein